ncbi:hypothetical protein [Streptomyces sp. bgisy095]|uniref:hypothetical protein n=1 Tax=unclassified Streptomyces TaxID=2593676 RepID=UPI003D72F9E0
MSTIKVEAPATLTMGARRQQLGHLMTAVITIAAQHEQTWIRSSLLTPVQYHCRTHSQSTTS